jgi:hypothetical protein
MGNGDFKDARNELSQGPNIVQPIVLILEFATIRMYTHLLNSDALTHGNAVTLTEEVNL